jgi:peptide deformylase
MTMSSLKIVTYPDKSLADPTEPLENIDQQVQEMIDKMTTTMYEAPGVGLAAIQVGWNKSVMIYDIEQNEGGSLRVLVNPRIVESDGELVSENEGCLSVPEFRTDVKRAARVLVDAVDRNGKPLRIEAEGLHAIVLQHEIDHLEGTLFIDRVSALKREMYKRRMKKKLRKQ